MTCHLENIESICFKARKIIGLLYRQFNRANSGTLLQLYLAMVRPHLEYASPVWNPLIQKQVKMIEDVEKFAMRVVTRRWNAGYQELLNMVSIPSIESRRLQSSMCTLYKIVHGLCYFPPDIVSLRPSLSQCSDRQFFSTNPLLAQMSSTVHLYHMLQTFGTHSLKGLSHPRLVLL